MRDDSGVEVLFRLGSSSRNQPCEKRVVVDGSVMEAFKVSPRDRVQQRFVDQISLTFQFLVVEVFKASSQDRVQRLRPLLRTRLVMWMKRLQGVFSTLLQNQQSARLGPHSGSELGAVFNPWTPAAYGNSALMATCRRRSRTRRWKRTH